MSTFVTALTPTKNLLSRCVANSGSSKNFMVCQAPQLGGNEALGADIFAGLWGIDKITAYPGCFEEAIYGLIESPLR
jgi:hypothetical protein